MIFERGQVASLTASRLSQRKIRTLAIAELNRLVEVDLLRQDITIYRHVDGADNGHDDPGYRQQSIIEIPVIRHQGEPLALQWDHFIDLVEGAGDVDAERDQILPAHQAVFAIRDGYGREELIRAKTEIAMDPMMSRD